MTPSDTVGILAPIARLKQHTQAPHLTRESWQMEHSPDLRGHLFIQSGVFTRSKCPINEKISAVHIFLLIQNTNIVKCEPLTDPYCETWSNCQGKVLSSLWLSGGSCRDYDQSCAPGPIKVDVTALISWPLAPTPGTDPGAGGWIMVWCQCQVSGHNDGFVRMLGVGGNTWGHVTSVTSAPRLWGSVLSGEWGRSVGRSLVVNPECEFIRWRGQCSNNTPSTKLLRLQLR